MYTLRDAKGSMKMKLSDHAASGIIANAPDGQWQTKNFKGVVTPVFILGDDYVKDVANGHIRMYLWADDYIVQDK